MATFGNQWNEALQISVPNFVQPPDITVANQTVQLRQIGYDAVAYGIPYVNDTVWLFYAREQPSGQFSMQGVECSYIEDVPSLSCQVLPNAVTPTGSNAYLPAAAVNFSTNAVWLSYWSDNVNPVGNLQMQVAKVSPTNGAFTIYALTGVAEVPCPIPVSETKGYWGDYDSLIIANYSSGFPTLLRYLTDSTASQCSTGRPQHVSVTFGDGAL